MGKLFCERVLSLLRNANYTKSIVFKWMVSNKDIYLSALRMFLDNLSTDFDMVGNKRTKSFHVLCCLGAQIVGINCHFDPETCVKTVKMMKEGVEKAGLKAHYMSQPLAFHTPDCNCQGFIDLPEFPFGMQALKNSISDVWNIIIHQYYFWQVWSQGYWPDGTCKSMPGRPIMLVSVTLVAAVGLKPITFVPWLRSCRLRGVSFLLAQRNMVTGEAIWRCTRSLGSEPGIDHHSSCI